MKPKYKTIALVAVLCSPFLWLCLHDMRPWAGRPSISIRYGELDVGCMGTQKTAGGDRPFLITSTSYRILRNASFAHTYHRDMTNYSAYLGLYATVIRNTYVVGSLEIERMDVAYSSVNPSKVTQNASGGKAVN